MITRLLRFIPAAAALAAAAFTMPAQAGVSWSVGISAPIAPGVAIGTVVGGGRPYFGAVIAPAPVYYEPEPVYYGPPPVYVPPPVYGRVVYGPPVYVGHPHYYRPPVAYRPVGRPYPPVQNWHPVRPGHGGYGPVAMAR